MKKIDHLTPYRAKRSLDVTPEPAGQTPGLQKSVKHPGPATFVIHHHGARSTHYDLRLEMEGVLRSWAVPKGPSPSIKDKRFAAKVEDHPIEYAGFEGRIPDGNYGAGWSIIWDRGTWIALSDPLEGLIKGKLLFELRGSKLQGKWTLVKLKGKNAGNKDWLFIKERDDHEHDGTTADFGSHSVLTGLSLADYQSELDPARRLRKQLVRLKCPMLTNHVKPKPMLAKAAEPFSHKDWLFEAKYDGYRILAVKAGLDVRLYSRNGNDLSRSFPEICDLLLALPYDRFVLDGEAVVHNAEGLPDFARMQQRGRLNRPGHIERARQQYPAVYYCFDLLEFEEYNTRSVALSKRKEILKSLLPVPGLLRYSDHVIRDGKGMFAAAKELGLEGIVAKKARSAYDAGRSDNWLKMRVDQTDDFTIMGYRVNKSGRDIRSLMVGQFVGDNLVYSGNVGSGLTASMGAELLKIFGAASSNARRSGGQPAPENAPADSDHIWLNCDLVCEVRYKEFTRAGLLRHPVFIRLRDDKLPQDCRRQNLDWVLPETQVENEPVQKNIVISNRDKVFWPDNNLNKGDLVDYYERISPWLLPWLKDRPLVLTRYPDGIEGRSFYQKDAPAFTPDWIQTEKIWSESTHREIAYFVINNLESLRYIANLGTVPIHIYHSRIQHPEQPDWCVLDLDPKEAPFSDVMTIAREIRHLCKQISIPSYVKTSGSTGMHVLLPLGGQASYEESRILGELLARIITYRLPDIATIVRNPARRDRKVYVDFLQNGAGKLIAAPYCLRPLPGAPMSMPLNWRDVTNRLRANSYTLQNAHRRLTRIQSDPCLPVLTDRVNLIEVLEKLGEVFARSVEAQS